MIVHQVNQPRARNAFRVDKAPQSAKNCVFVEIRFLHSIISMHLIRHLPGGKPESLPGPKGT